MRSASSSTTWRPVTRSRADRRRIDGSGGGHRVQGRQDRLPERRRPPGQAGHVAHQRPGLVADPRLHVRRDRRQVDMFWQAASVESNIIPFPVTSDPTDPRLLPDARRAVLPASPTATLPEAPGQGHACARCSSPSASTSWTIWSTRVISTRRSRPRSACSSSPTDPDVDGGDGDADVHRPVTNHPSRAWATPR